LFGNQQHHNRPQFQQQNHNHHHNQPPPRPLAGGPFSPFFPNKRASPAPADSKDWNAADIVQSLKAKTNPYGANILAQVEQNIHDLETELGFTEQNKDLDGLFERVYLFPQQRDEASQVYDLTPPDLRTRKRKPEPAVVVETAPLSAEVMKAGNIKKVNQKAVEKDIREAILKIDEQKKRAQKILQKYPPRTGQKKNPQQQRQQQQPRQPQKPLMSQKQQPPPMKKGWLDKIPKPPMPPPFWKKIPKLLR